MSDINIKIGAATQGDISGLLAINARWQLTHISNDKSHGFLSAEFSREEFSTVIDNSDIIVLKTGDEICGYYMVNNFSTNGVLAYHKTEVEKLKQSEVIDKNARVGVGTQAVLDKSVQGKGFRGQLLAALIEHVKHKYEFLFSSISKENPRAFRAHTDDGWYVVDENETVKFVLLNLSS